MDYLLSILQPDCLARQRLMPTPPAPLTTLTWKPGQSLLRSDSCLPVQHTSQQGHPPLPPGGADKWASHLCRHAVPCLCLLPLVTLCLQLTLLNSQPERCFIQETSRPTQPVPLAFQSPRLCHVLAACAYFYITVCLECRFSSSDPTSSGRRF